MANSYTQLTIQFVFAVKGRAYFLLPKHNNELQKYITGIVQNRKSKLLSINNISDHIHILVGISPTYSVSKLTQEIKNNSSKFINQKSWYSSKFAWQSGYGAFSYSHSHRDAVIKYIENQQIHHQTENFQTEYLKFLEKFGIEYDEKYIFDFYD
ncbi:MAG: IS200/IS605 family transposase [Bacteroidota bacterium]|nr:IS200/IS605 family transposase [Bacteroidota bacterium]